MRKRHWLVAGLGIALCAASFVTSTSNDATILWASSLTANLAAGFVGAFITVLIIDRALERERARQQQQFRDVAINSLRGPYSSHVRRLATFYVECENTPFPSKVDDIVPPALRTVHDLVTAISVDQLDSFLMSPNALLERHELSWRHLRESLQQFIGAIDATTDRYAVFLTSQSLALLDTGERDAKYLIEYLADAASPTGHPQDHDENSVQTTARRSSLEAHLRFLYELRSLVGELDLTDAVRFASRMKYYRRNLRA